MDVDRLKKSLRLHEGVRTKLYQDTVGKWSIGCGRNLSDVGLSTDEIDYLLMNDIRRAQNEAAKYTWFRKLDDVRQNVVTEMLFNLGAVKFGEFTNTKRNIEMGNYSAAATSMLQSRWASQVGGRAKTLAEMMRSGKWPV